MSWNIFIESYAITHPGKVRKNNEDSLLCLESEGFFAISDGMGGGESGEVASQMAVQCLQNAFDEPTFVPGVREGNVIQAIYAANNRINDYAADHHFAMMGATVICFLLNLWTPDAAVILHAGDSRLYRCRQGQLACLTEDHTIASAAKLSENQLASKYRGVLTNALGSDKGFFLERDVIEIQQDDIYILCSDGLSRMVPEEELEEICSKNAELPSRKLNEILIEAALAHGGRDNVSVIVVKIKSKWDDYVPGVEEIAQESEAQYQNQKALCLNTNTATTEDISKVAVSAQSCNSSQV